MVAAIRRADSLAVATPLLLQGALQVCRSEAALVIKEAALGATKLVV